MIRGEAKIETINRGFDWTARLWNSEGEVVGVGATEADAIADLYEELEAGNAQ